MVVYGLYGPKERVAQRLREPEHLWVLFGQSGEIVMSTTYRLAFGLVALSILAVLSTCGSSTPGQKTGDVCTKDEDCPDHWFCDTLDTGRCREIVCTSDDECKPNQFCDQQNTHDCQDSACSKDQDCPLLWLCDLDKGTCYDPDPTTTSCTTVVPGCPCDQDHKGDTVGCRPQTVDPRVDTSCHTAISECNGERWGACHDVYSDACDTLHMGSGSFVPTEDNSQNVDVGMDGELVLDPDEKQLDFGYVWIANSGENTVSKMDVATGKEVARYPSVMDGIPNLPQITVPYPASDPYNDCANCPSRTAIDFNGDAYVANRAFGYQGSVTKFANVEEDCIDRDGDDAITTSWDANGDGHIDITDPVEFPGFDDECLLWTAPVGGNNGVPRALAIDAGGSPDLSPNGNVWVGLYNEQKAVQLNGIDGQQVLSVDLQGVHPYGAAVDAGSRVWFTSISDGTMAEVDTLTGSVIDIIDVAAGTGCVGSYGIAVDVHGRIWLGGFSCNTAIRYDPADKSFATIDFSNSDRGPHTRGIAPDLQDTVWVAHTAGWVTRFDANTMQEIKVFQVQHHTPGEQVDNTIGVGIDRNGACWVVSRNDAYPNGTATRILPDGTQDAWPVGLMPYTYSDFTGFGMQTVVRPSGWYNLIVSACEDPDPNPPDHTTRWHTLSWHEGEPGGSSVRLRFKVGDDLDTLEDQPWFGPYDTPPVDLAAEGVPNAQYMFIQILMSAANVDMTPTFGGLTLDFDCNPGNPES